MILKLGDAVAITHYIGTQPADASFGAIIGESHSLGSNQKIYTILWLEDGMITTNSIEVVERWRNEYFELKADLHLD